MRNTRTPSHIPHSPGNLKPLSEFYENAIVTQQRNINSSRVTSPLRNFTLAIKRGPDKFFPATHDSRRKRFLAQHQQNRALHPFCPGSNSPPFFSTLCLCLFALSFSKKGYAALFPEKVKLRVKAGGTAVHPRPSFHRRKSCEFRKPRNISGFHCEAVGACNAAKLILKGQLNSPRFTNRAATITKFANDRKRFFTLGPTNFQPDCEIIQVLSEARRMVMILRSGN